MRTTFLIDTSEVKKRGAGAQFLLVTQIEDESGAKVRADRSIDFAELPNDVPSGSVTYSQDMFVRPGNYRVSTVICDPKTLVYSFSRHKLHVDRIPGDPLPDLWNDVPDAEAIPDLDAPDRWFLPESKDALRLPLSSPRPVELQIVMNLTDAGTDSGSLAAFNRNMGGLVPALKILTQLATGDRSSLKVKMLDLVHRKVAHQQVIYERGASGPAADGRSSPEQKHFHGLDWDAMRRAIKGIQPAIVDVATLSQSKTMQRFLWDQLFQEADFSAKRAVNTSQSLHVLLFLSAPVVLTNQDRMDPITLPADPNRKVYYINYRPAREPIQPLAMPRDLVDPRLMPAELRSFSRRYYSSPSERRGGSFVGDDDLSRMLKALNARVFAVSTPLEFRGALAKLLTDISKNADAF